MDPYVANPHWGFSIIAYFYLGGIAAGAYALARLIDLFGDDSDRRAARAADYLAFPLVNLCGLLLVIDLNRPERFWHMMIQSETFRPMFKWWSPMSAGSWGLSAFGAFSFVSFVGVLAEDGRFGLGRWRPWAERLHRGWFGRAYTVLALLSAYFLGSYTGVLLSASNQPIWADTTWISPLFLASAASTGLATLILWNSWRRYDERHAEIGRLEWADHWAIGLELLSLVGLVVSIGRQGLLDEAFGRWPGWLVPALVVPFGMIGPVVLGRRKSRAATLAAMASVLVAGLVLRAAIVGIPGPLLVVRN